MTNPQGQISSKLLGAMIGFPITLIALLFDNADAFMDKPGVALFGLLLFGSVVSFIAYVVIAGLRGEERSQTFREDWHDAVGKPKNRRH